MGLRLSARAQAILVLALVATLGALLGILGDRLLAQHDAARVESPQSVGRMPPPGGPPLYPRGARRFVERLAEELELTPEQRVRIDSIVAEERARVQQLTAEVQPRFRQIAEQTRTRIDAVLTAEQRAELRRIRQERFRQERLRRREPASDRRSGR